MPDHDEMPQWFMAAWNAHLQDFDALCQDLANHRTNAHGTHRQAQVKDWALKAGGGGGALVILMDILNRLFGGA